MFYTNLLGLLYMNATKADEYNVHENHLQKCILLFSFINATNYSKNGFTNDYHMHFFWLRFKHKSMRHDCRLLRQFMQEYFIQICFCLCWMNAAIADECILSKNDLNKFILFI